MSSEYVDIRELHPACVKLPCRYDACENERWVCGSGSTHEHTVCEECYDGPEVMQYLPKPVVRL